MIHLLESADAEALSAFDGIIDVRSPGEFAEDHAPGAINLPVLTDAERAEVGAIYVQESPFRAGRIGAAYVARNIARHLDGALRDEPKAFKPLVYCWRGGQRSNAMATVLSQVGWRTTVLSGGYKTYRSHVRERLYDAVLAYRLVLLDGGTGSGKTEMLGRLADLDVQVLDLEGLAGHRGSLFGALPGQAQPSQKMFESRLLTALGKLDPGHPVVVEAESSKIGERLLPPTLMQAMAAAPRIELVVPAAERAKYLVRAYDDISAATEHLDAAIEGLAAYQGQKRSQAWAAMARAKDFGTLAAELIDIHYDPAYRRSSRKDPRPRLAVLDVDALSDAGLQTTAREIQRLVAASPVEAATAPAGQR